MNNPVLPKPFITSPLIWQLAALIIWRPLVLAPALLPFNSIIGAPAKPGWVEPSIVTVSVIVGSAEIGLIVCKPEPGILNVIRSAPELPLASRIACRKEPRPLSLALVTVKVVAASGITT